MAADQVGGDAVGVGIGGLLSNLGLGSLGCRGGGVVVVAQADGTAARAAHPLRAVLQGEGPGAGGGSCGGPGAAPCVQ